jgi:molybdate transport system regulatory protein
VARVRLSLYLGAGLHKLGPGKVQLLESIGECGSISGAAREMGMAYRHAWALIDELNGCFAEPLVAVKVGGRSGGGAELTPAGAEICRRFHRIEAATERAIARDLGALESRLAKPARPRRKGRVG